MCNPISCGKNYILGQSQRPKVAPFSGDAFVSHKGAWSIGNGQSQKAAASKREDPRQLREAFGVTINPWKLATSSPEAKATANREGHQQFGRPFGVLQPPWKNETYINQFFSAQHHMQARWSVLQSVSSFGFQLCNTTWQRMRQRQGPPKLLRFLSVCSSVLFGARN